MKLIFSIILVTLTTGCAMNPYRMANYFPEGESPRYSSTAGPRTSTALPTSGVIVTNSGNYVIVPNYSTGGISAVLGPR